MAEELGPEEMAEELNTQPELIREWRTEARQTKSAEERVTLLQNALQWLAALPNELDEEALELCEEYSPDWNEFNAGLAAQSIEVYSDEEDQIALARRFRELCREAFAQDDYCIFVEQVLPLVEGLIAGVIQADTAES